MIVYTEADSDLILPVLMCVHEHLATPMQACFLKITIATVHGVGKCFVVARRVKNNIIITMVGVVGCTKN